MEQFTNLDYSSKIYLIENWISQLNIFPESEEIAVYNTRYDIQKENVTGTKIQAFLQLFDIHWIISFFDEYYEKKSTEPLLDFVLKESLMYKVNKPIVKVFTETEKIDVLDALQKKDKKLFKNWCDTVQYGKKTHWWCDEITIYTDYFSAIVFFNNTDCILDDLTKTYKTELEVIQEIVSSYYGIDDHSKLYLKKIK